MFQSKCTGDHWSPGICRNGPLAQGHRLCSFCFWIDWQATTWSGKSVVRFGKWLLWYGVGGFKKISDKVTLWWCHDTTENIIYLNQPINQSINQPITVVPAHSPLSHLPIWSLTTPINHCLTHPPYFLIHFFTHSLMHSPTPPPPPPPF